MFYKCAKQTLIKLLLLNKRYNVYQQRYRTKYGNDPPSRPSIRRWHKEFMETGSVSDAVRNGQGRTTAENIESVRRAFSRSVKLLRTAVRELEFPPATVHKHLHKRLPLYAYKVQMLWRLQPNDKPKQKEFADIMLQRISEDEEFLERNCSNDEKICGTTN